MIKFISSSVLCRYFYIMPHKCCIPQWKSNYLSEEKKKNEKVSVYRFSVDKQETKKWIRAIPRENVVVNNNTQVCHYHWPPNRKLFISYRCKEAPTELPSVFDGIPASCLSSPPPKPRKLFSLLVVVETLFLMNLNNFVKRIIWYAVMSLKKLELIMI